MKNIAIVFIFISIISCNVDWTSNKGSDFIYVKITSETTDKECLIHTSYYNGTIELPYEDTYKFSPKDSFILNLAIKITAIEENMDISIYVNINGQKEYTIPATLILNEPYNIYLKE